MRPEKVPNASAKKDYPPIDLDQRLVRRAEIEKMQLSSQGKIGVKKRA